MTQRHLSNRRSDTASSALRAASGAACATRVCGPGEEQDRGAPVLPLGLGRSQRLLRGHLLGVAHLVHPSDAAQHLVTREAPLVEVNVDRAVHVAFGEEPHQLVPGEGVAVRAGDPVAKRRKLLKRQVAVGLRIKVAELSHDCSARARRERRRAILAQHLDRALH
eukprot:94480-Prymnesium_polylepis.2